MDRLLPLDSCYHCKHEIGGSPPKCTSEGSLDEWKELPRDYSIPDWCKLEKAGLREDIEALLAELNEGHLLMLTKDFIARLGKILEEKT